jgi:hypothetical protein
VARFIQAKPTVIERVAAGATVCDGEDNGTCLRASNYIACFGA